MATAEPQILQKVRTHPQYRTPRRQFEQGEGLIVACFVRKIVAASKCGSGIPKNRIVILRITGIDV